MKEVKFKAYYREEMCEVVTLNLDTQSAIIQCKDSSAIHMNGKQPVTNKLVRLSDVELLQYTVLKNNNGLVNIYENPKLIEVEVNK